MFRNHIDGANLWLSKGEMVAIVSEKSGGIIGYMHIDHAEDVISALNLRAIKENGK